MLTTNLQNEITGAERVKKTRPSWGRYKVDRFLKSQKFSLSIKSRIDHYLCLKINLWVGFFTDLSTVNQKKIDFFEWGGVFSLDKPFNGWPLSFPQLLPCLQYHEISKDSKNRPDSVEIINFCYCESTTFAILTMFGSVNWILKAPLNVPAISSIASLAFPKRAVIRINAWIIPG